MGIGAGVVTTLVGTLTAFTAVALWIASAAHRGTSFTRLHASVLTVFMAVGFTGTALGWIGPDDSAATGGVSTHWRVVRTAAEFDAVFEKRPAGKPVVVDFHADWCADCRVAERTVFSDGATARRLDKGFFTIRVDATKGADPLVQVARRFGVVGVPAVRFFADDGAEREDLRIDGAFGPESFMRNLEAVKRVGTGDGPTSS